MPYMNKLCAIAALNIIQGLLLVLPLQLGKLWFAISLVSYAITYDLIQYTNKRFYKVFVFFIVLLLSLIVQQQTAFGIIIGLLIGLISNVRKLDAEVNELVSQSSISTLMDIFIDRSCPILGSATFAFMLQEQLSISLTIILLGAIFRIFITGSQDIYGLSYKRFDEVKKYSFNYLNIVIAFLSGITGYLGLYQIVRTDFIFYSLILSIILDYAQLIIKLPLLTIFFILHVISFICIIINLQYFFVIQVALLNFMTLIDDSKPIKMAQAFASAIVLLF